MFRTKIMYNLFVLIISIIDKYYVNKKFIVFGSRAGRQYADNSKYLYEYYLKQGEEVYFITRNKAELQYIPGNPVYAYSAKAAMIMLGSKILFCTHGRSDFFPFKFKKNTARTIVHLFHAIPVKIVADNSKRQNLEIVHWNKFLTSSHFEAEFLSKQFKIDRSRFLVLGQPRNDILWLSANRVVENSKSFILYAPTFRDQERVRLFPFDDANLVALDKYLSTSNQELHIRVHPNDERYFRSLGYNEMYSNIKVINPKEEPTINDVLYKYSRLLTDYSSIALDFLIFNRPIGYIPYDYVSYDSTRGFSFDYFEHLAGPVIHSQVDLLAFLRNDMNASKQKRLNILNKFHEFKDGKSSERIYRYCQDILFN